VTEAAVNPRLVLFCRSIVAKRQNDESPHEWVYSNEIKVTITPKEAGK
jgi:hypothetical protein